MDPAAFEETVRGWVEPLRRFLRRRTDPETAEDALAETLLVCWRRWAELEQPALPWAYAVARGALANAERASRRQRRVAAKVAALDPPRAVTGPVEVDLDLAEALAALSADDAEVLRLWAWEQLEPREVAVVLGISANAASVRLHRARERLRAQLGKTGPVAGHEGSRGGGDR